MGVRKKGEGRGEGEGREREREKEREEEYFTYIRSKCKFPIFFPFAIFQELRKIVWSGHQLKTTESKQSQNGGNCNFDHNNELNSF